MVVNTLLMSWMCTTSIHTYRICHRQVVILSSAPRSDTDPAAHVRHGATLLKRSLITGPALCFADGPFGGLAVGMGGVMLAALVSRRLRPK